MPHWGGLRIGGQLDLSVPGALGVAGNGLLDLGEGFGVAIPDHRNDQTLLRADGDADVVKMVGDNFLAVDPGVHLGHGLERFDHGLDEKRHETELGAMLLDEGVLDPLAEGHDFAHVALIEGRQYRGFLLSANQL